MQSGYGPVPAVRFSGIPGEIIGDPFVHRIEAARRDKYADPAGQWALNLFVLPARVKEELQEALDRLEDEIARQQEQERQARDAKTPGGEDANLVTDLVWKEPFAPDANGWLPGGPIRRVLRRHDVDALYLSEGRGTRSRDPDDAKRIKALCRELAGRGEFRCLAMIPMHWQSRLAALAVRFPNFTEVIGYVQAMFTLAQFTSYPGLRVPKLGPILLDGPPGTGKSTFAQALAELMEVPHYRFDMAGMQSGGALTGSDVMWANTRCGQVMTTLLENDFANPVFILDEIDKVRADERFSPDGALLSLLEPSTSEKFHDLSVPELTVDASQAIWIATSNDRDRISVPLRHRFRVFEIPGLRPAQARAVAKTIFDDLLKQMKIAHHPYRLEPKALERAATLSPRLMQRALREAIAYSSLGRGKRVTLNHLSRALAGADAEIHGASRLGFV